MSCASRHSGVKPFGGSGSQRIRHQLSTNQNASASAGTCSQSSGEARCRYATSRPCVGGRPYRKGQPISALPSGSGSPYQRWMQVLVIWTVGLGPRTRRPTPQRGPRKESMKGNATLPASRPRAYGQPMPAVKRAPEVPPRRPDSEPPPRRSRVLASAATLWPKEPHSTSSAAAAA